MAEEIEILHVVEPGTLSNCYILGCKGRAIVIDPNVFEEIEAILEEKNWKPEQIFLTHEHFDHIMGLEQLRSKRNIPVWASETASQAVQDGKANMSGIYDMFVYYRVGEMPAQRHRKFTCRPAEHTFSQEMEVFWMGHRFYFYLLPGHSAGSTLIFLDDDILFSGDYFLDEKTKAAPFSGGSEETIQQLTLPYLRKLPGNLHIYRGHGSDFNLGEMRRRKEADIDGL